MTALGFSEKYKDYIRDAGARLYWPEPSQKELLNSLPVYNTAHDYTADWVYVALPEWAADLGVDGKGILVDVSSCKNASKPDWRETNWWAAAFHYLNGSAERQAEIALGKPLHSYSFRMPNSHADLYEYAWFNRILLFLRRWAAHENGIIEEQTFPAKPDGAFLLTHDVDYIKKTFPLIIKKSVFDVMRFIKSLASLKIGEAFQTAFKAIQFALTPRRYNLFSHIVGLEKNAGYTSVFNFYPGRSVSKKSWLLDPSYSLEDVAGAIAYLEEKGCEIGLHPTYGCWENGELYNEQKALLDKYLKTPTESVRQHWLRFSWQSTWKAQSLAGLKRDTTLLWNDRPGFRNSTALWFSPLHDGEVMDGFQALPTAIMDSHFFDYTTADEQTQFARLKHYLDEVRFVGGEIAIVWHHRVFHPETGWGGLYEKLLNYIKLADDEKR